MKSLEALPGGGAVAGSAKLGMVLVAKAPSISKNGLKHLSKHLDDFKKFDNNFGLSDQVKLGKNIASNPANLVNVRNGSHGFEAVVQIGGNSVRVRSVVNAAGNLRSVYPL